MMFGFSRMRVVSTNFNDTPALASRPFDLGRDGFVLGEGAWMVVLEREDRARARGARIYASIDGYASTCDAFHRVQMAPDGKEIVRAIALAIERSGDGCEEIGYVSYHGTSTVLNDTVESRCVRQVFGRPAATSVSRLAGEVDDRPSAGGQRRGRHRDRRPGARAASFCRRRSISSIPTRRAISTIVPNQGGPPRSTRRCATASGSDRRTA